jgi:DNA-binding HxlR family transcriptional regulator
MSTPMPGQRVRGSASGRPIMAALDLFGRRWVLRILWELTDQPLGFRALQQACDGMSSSVLASRLADLTAARLVHVNDQGEYLLTGVAGKLLIALGPLWQWSEEWAESLARPEDPA